MHEVGCRTILAYVLHFFDYLLLFAILCCSSVNFINLHVLKNCCVWNYMPVEVHCLRMTLT